MCFLLFNKSVHPFCIATVGHVRGQIALCSYNRGECLLCVVFCYSLCLQVTARPVFLYYFTTLLLLDVPEGSRRADCDAPRVGSVTTGGFATGSKGPGCSV